MPEIWRRLEAVGLSTTEACGDCPRVILGSPVAGIAADEIIDPTAGHPATSSTATSAIRSSPTCRASSRPRSPVTRCRTSSPRSTTSRSSASCTPSTAPASTCGSAAGCPPTRCWPSGSAPGCRCDEVAEVWAGVVGDLPRLRLPPAAHPGPDQVPGRRLGRGEVPRGAGDRVPEAHADRRPGPGHPGAARRPRRGATCRRTATTTSALSAVGRADRRHDADRAGRPRRGARLVPAAHHPDAEDPGPGRAPRTGSTSLVAGAERDRPVGPAERLAPLGDGLHRHRVLQARHRRDQGPGGPGGRRAGDSGSASSTRRSPSTSTAARTPAPGSRSPTSV